MVDELMHEKRKILLVSHNFPPTAGPESNLVKINASFLHHSGFQVRVLTTPQSHTIQGLDATLLKGLPADMIIDRVAGPESALENAIPYFGRFVNIAAGRYILPEVYLPWSFPAIVRGEDIVREWKPDIIYSRATKHVSNVVGWRLKKSTGLPWVAHFSDPWITGGLPYKPLQRILGRYFERQILRDADSLVFVATQAAERVMRNYPAHWREKVHIIPHGYETVSTDTLPAKQTKQRPLQVIHAGSFYPGLRSPTTLIEALKRLQQKQALTGRLAITCIGEDTTQYQPQVEAAGLSHIIKLQPSESFDACQRHIALSDLILIIDMAHFGGVFLPTKLMEAMAFNHQILGLTEANSAMADVLRKTGLNWAELTNPDAIAQEFSVLLAKWESGEWKLTSKQRVNMDQFQLDQVNQPLLKLFDSLTRGLPQTKP